MTHRAPHDFPQHVAAMFVGWDDAVGDQKRHRAQMVSDHPHRNIGRFVRAAVFIGPPIPFLLLQRRLAISTLGLSEFVGLRLGPSLVIVPTRHVVKLGFKASLAQCEPDETQHQ